MKTWKVTIYPKTQWSVRVEAETEEEAKEKALNLEGPSQPAYADQYDDEWWFEIWEWPNIGNNNVDIEED